MGKEILTTFEAAKYCHVHPGTIKNWIKNENLQAFKTPGGHRRIYRSDLDEFLKDNNIPIISESKTQRKRVLIIDSDYLVREQISKSFIRQIVHFEVVTAASGFEAGELMVAFKPNLVILDFGLPGIDAVEVCRRIKHSMHLEEPKILVLSSSQDKNRMQSLLEQGDADYWLAKSSDIDKLCVDIDRLLGLR
jgi:excisionase family DNA binding protein